MMMQPQYPVPPWMFGAVQNTESGGNPNAVSPAGAVGPMQVMPTTLTDPGFGVAPARDNSPQEQQRVGKDYLQAMMQRYQGDPQKALMAYNWGPGNVDKLQSGQMQPSQIPAETQAYVPKVMNQQPLSAGTQYAQNENIQTDATGGMKEVTDPALLKQLNGESGMKEVTDPALLAQLNGQKSEPSSDSNDALLSALGGVEKGAAGTLMLLPNIANGVFASGGELTKMAYPMLSGMAPDTFPPLSEKEIYATPNAQPLYGSQDLLNALPSYLQPHVPTTPMGVGTDLMGQFLGSIAGVKAIRGAANGGVNNSRSLWGNNQGEPSTAPQSYRSNEMFDKANEYYDAADQGKAVIGAPKITDAKTQILSDLQKNNYDPDFHPDTAKWLAKLEEKSTDDAGNPVDLEWSKVNGLRKLLNGDITKNLRQGNNEDAYQAMTARTALDRSMNNMQSTDLTSGDPAAINLTRQGNTLFSAATKQEEIQNILDKGDTAKVPSTVYQNGLSKLAQKLKNNSSGYTPEEIEAINYGAKTGIVVPILRTLGGKITSGMLGGISGALGGGIPGALGGMVAGEAAAFPFRAGANALTRRGGTNVQDLIGLRPNVQAAMK